MNRALKWKLIAGFLLVFAAGGMTGAFVVAKPVVSSGFFESLFESLQLFLTNTF